MLGSRWGRAAAVGGQGASCNASGRSTSSGCTSHQAQQQQQPAGAAHAPSAKDDVGQRLARLLQRVQVVRAEGWGDGASCEAPAIVEQVRRHMERSRLNIDAGVV